MWVERGGTLIGRKINVPVLSYVLLRRDGRWPLEGWRKDTRRWDYGIRGVNIRRDGGVGLNVLQKRRKGSSGQLFWYFVKSQEKVLEYLQQDKWSVSRETPS